MKKLYRTLLPAVLFLSILALPGAFVNAQTESASTDTANMMEKPRMPVSPNVLQGIKKESIKDGARIASTTKINTVPTTTRANIRADLEAKREEMKARAREHMKKFLGQIIERLSAAVERAEKLIDRITSRIEKLKERGIDTTAAEGFLSDASGFIDQAKTTISSIPGAIDTAVASDELRGAFEGVRSLIEKAKGEIKSAYESIRKAIESLKLSAGVERQATTTTQ